MGISQYFNWGRQFWKARSEISFENENSSDCIKLLKSIRGNNLNRLVFTQLNISSIRNKFWFLVKQIKGYIDVLMISETKTNESFPIGK